MALRLRLRGPEGKQHTCVLGEVAEFGDLVNEAAKAFAVDRGDVEVLLGFPPTLCEADADTPLTSLVRSGDAAVVRLRSGAASAEDTDAQQPAQAATPALAQAMSPAPAPAVPTPSAVRPQAPSPAAAAPLAPRIATLPSGAPWACKVCTLENPASAATCDACGEANPSAPAGADLLAATPVIGGDWECPQCTLINAASDRECAACGGPAPAANGGGGAAPVQVPAPAPVAPPPPAPAQAVSSAGCAISSGKRAFPEKDPSDVLAQPVHGSAKKPRGEDPLAGTEVRMSEAEVLRITRVVFGDKPEAADVERWLSAGFNFSTRKGTEWGLWQRHGGPCGVFAPVQGFILKHLLFGEAAESVAADKREGPLVMHVGEEDTRWSVLAYALASVLFHATPSSSYAVCQVAVGEGHGAASTAAAFVAGGGSALTVTMQRVSRITDAQQLFEDAAASWLSGPCGVLSFVVSVLVSRGLERISEDADDPGTPLIGRFGHCSQELVNLMLIGEATSNVFDGSRWLGDDPSTGMLVKGIDGDKVGVPQVGYLSEMEAMRYLSVGTLYKHPDFPIWVLGSPTHYTVLFSTRRSDSQLSEGAALEQKAKKVFIESSVDDGGIAMSAHLGKMLEALGIPGDQFTQAHSELVNEDIVLWMDFHAWVRRAKGIDDTPAAARSRLQLFLYDGQDPPGPNLRSVVVELTDVDPSFAGGNDADAFSATLHTRWPNAVVSVDAAGEGAS